MLILRNKTFGKKERELIYKAVEESGILPRITGTIEKITPRKTGGKTVEQMMEKAPEGVKELFGHLRGNRVKAADRTARRIQEAELNPVRAGEMGFMNKNVPIKKRAWLKRRYDRIHNGGEKSYWGYENPSVRRQKEAEALASAERMITKRTGIGTVASPR